MSHWKYDAGVIDRIGNRRTARLYIREWMEAKHLNNKKLAERMERSEGTISKLLAAADPPKPGEKKRATTKVTVEYLAEFANALDVDVAQLFHDPARPTRDELLKGYSTEELTIAVQLIDQTRASTARQSETVVDRTDTTAGERKSESKPTRRAG